MTDEELATIEQRANAATAGPWRRDEPLEIWSASGMVAGVPEFRPDNHRPASDAIFIEHARSDVPALIAEVRAYRRAIEAVRKLRAAPPLGSADGVNEALLYIEEELAKPR